MGKISKDKRDIYYRLAKQKDFRSRSAFKILQIDEYFNIFNNNKFIVDLCSAPGGWSQVASNLIDKQSDYKIISIDLQEIAPLDDVDIIIGDITRQNTLEQIIKSAKGNKIDLVMCDGAPDVTGFNEFDVYIQMQLILSALNITIRMIREGGIFITKIFKGKHTNKILQILKKFFAKITIAKPRACRNASFESFLVCEEFYLSECTINLIEKELNSEDIIILNNLWTGEEIDLVQLGIDFIQVGNEEYDSDKTYDLEGYTHIEPLQMPINPPYKYYIENLKGIKYEQND